MSTRRRVDTIHENKTCSDSRSIRILCVIWSVGPDRRSVERNYVGIIKKSNYVFQLHMDRFIVGWSYQSRINSLDKRTFYTLEKVRNWYRIQRGKKKPKKSQLKPQSTTTIGED